jgi:hypothetical protein
MKWERFTKRTEDPKLAWLERQLTEAGIQHRRNGASFHAPILEVQADKIDEAWAILTPVDDIPDDDPRWGGNPEWDIEPPSHITDPDDGVGCRKCGAPMSDAEYDDNAGICFTCWV